MQHRICRAFLRPVFVYASFALLASIAAAQQGDQPGEAQAGLPPDLVVPDAPPLTPHEALASFTVEPGFRIELVAAEPLIEDPVAIAFGEDGRIWVVEMRGFMPNADGTGEQQPVGRVVILDDDDGDGVMDRSTVFLDDLVLPRAIALSHGGAVIVEPPELLFFRDTHGDGRADEMLHLYFGFGGLESPEHAGNGLIRGIDNWLYVSQHPLRFRFDGDEVVSEPTPGHGQWGITRDRVGRLFYTTNSDPLRADLVPLHYAGRNPNLRSLVGVNERVLHDFEVWPIRITPGVNRGYRQGTLRDDYTLHKFTGACGPCIYQGDLFPETHRGNGFICEPAGNLVKRCLVTEDEDGRLRGELPYRDAEFLASTDERFRPVNAYTGPDGALYVVDMYRGILQHRIFMTSFLRKQVEDRGLDRPIGMGRIYRIVPEGSSPGPRPSLGTASDATLVSMLDAGNGWTRATAQRLLVERQAIDVVEPLRQLVRTATREETILHALWTLDGLGAVSLDDVREACTHPSAIVRATGVRLLDERIADRDAIEIASQLAVDDSRVVRRQVALTLSATTSPAGHTALDRFINRHIDEREIRSAVMSGLHNREIATVRRLAAGIDWAQETPGRRTFVDVAVEYAVRGGASQRRVLLELIAEHDARPAWVADRMLARLGQLQRIDDEIPRTLMLDREPRGWSRWLAARDPSDGAAARVDQYLEWVGRRHVDGRVRVRPLTPAEQSLYDDGARLYGLLCVSCHQRSGMGQRGLAPSLVGTSWVLGSEDRLVRILLHGMTGPVTVDGATFNGDMPRSPARRDEEIAAIVTYVRRAWGNTAAPVAPQAVARIREATSDRRQPWTVPELKAIRSFSDGPG